MLYYCPLKDCECKYRYCPCFTGNTKEEKFRCMFVDLVKLKLEEQKSRMMIQELAETMTKLQTCTPSQIERMFMEDDGK